MGGDARRTAADTERRRGTPTRNADAERRRGTPTPNAVAANTPGHTAAMRG
ncbi:hypothetical protein FM119_02915 [Mycetocola reblochoni REB411]|uniref:Uncharacterized protein n=1 Tax=Mycetocola reblochoni REB411 TaxID=1255698 RepID=A0A1R4IPP7_9MICO|nr:hypothetical protein FM119_02915 [Mycetocola reblochoni REB411]